MTVKSECSGAASVERYFSLKCLPAKVVDPVTRARLQELQARKARLEMALRAKERVAKKASVRRKANSDLSDLKRKMGLD